MVCGPTTVAVYVTEQRPVASRVQLPPPLNAPLSVLNVTAPVGVVAPVPAVSVTVTVQVVVPFTGTVAGVQLTLVLVDRATVVPVPLVLLLLTPWRPSPSYDTVIGCAPPTVAA